MDSKPSPIPQVPRLDEGSFRSYLQQRYQEEKRRSPKKPPADEYALEEFEAIGVTFPEGKPDCVFIEERSGTYVLMLSLANGLAALRYDPAKGTWRNHHDFLLHENIEEGREKIEASHRSKFRRAIAALLLVNAGILAVFERDRLYRWGTDEPVPFSAVNNSDNAENQSELETARRELEAVIVSQPITPEEQVEKLTALTRIQERIRMLEGGLGTEGR